jgi:two-component system CheB/CheR fusion protein
MFIVPVDLVTLVREEIEAAQALTTQHTIELQTSFEAVEIAADGQRLRQVLGNLISNAIRYSPAGGVISVTLTTAPDQAPPFDTAPELR